MNGMTRISATVGCLALALGLAPAVLGQANDAEGYGDGYQSGAYGRIRFADGAATIVRADSERGQSDVARLNAPVFPGDTLRTDSDQRVEVQLAGGTIVRIDRGGELVFQSLPNPSAQYEDNSVLVLNGGVIRVTSRLRDKEEFRVDTRDASIYLLGEGEFRIETGDRGGTQVASLRGVAEVVGNDASVLVRGGMRTVALAGSAPETPHSYTAFASDGFDRWCDSRDDAYRAHEREPQGEDDRESVPSEVRPYYSELSLYGSWLIDPNYGHVWCPSGVAAGWRPYYDGYWSYGPSGYFWVSYEPWGWAPYHYGNWQWIGHRGWCWVPGHVFAGAWVSWSWGSLYVGWAPLDFWGRPGWIGGPYYYGYYDPGCWTFVNYSHLAASNVRRYAVPVGTVHDDLGHATVVARPPRVDPRRIAESPTWRERALRMVADDHPAQMHPINAAQHPDRRFSDVQDHLARRPSPTLAAPHGTRDASASPLIDRRSVMARPRRILEDPRAGERVTARPDTRDDVRELYQRMSRPRETRRQEIAPQQDPRGLKHDRPEPPSVDQRRAEPPRFESPRVAAPRVEPPREHAPRTQAPPMPSPRMETPRGAPGPRPQAAPRPHGEGQAKEKHGGGKR